MQRKITIQLTPLQANDALCIKTQIADVLQISLVSISGYHILKRSIDARSKKQIWIVLSLLVFIEEEKKIPVFELPLKDVAAAAKKVIIVGAGPAGLFAALELIAAGIQPIVIERGKNVRQRRRDLAVMNKKGIVNTESNYCFGEGGAGTYSDGKLYTRSTKRGDIEKILQTFVYFGASENILYEAHPHIGTNKLPQIIAAISEKIIAQGGNVLFDTKMVDLVLEQKKCKGIILQNGTALYADGVVLATGHSARDVYFLLKHKNIKILPKPLAIGVRVEHPQSLINEILYHQFATQYSLPSATYAFTITTKSSSVFSFCMCPGGIIAAAATDVEEIVVNGWSPSKRNNFFANSGLVVGINPNQVIPYLNQTKNYPTNLPEDPLVMLYLQAMVEKKSFEAGGSKGLTAPAQRIVDFAQGTLSANLNESSYVPGLRSAAITGLFPDFIANPLQASFLEINKKLKGFYTNEAQIIATESRTSAPVTIPRNKLNYQHIEIENLYPCGEGAGYAGGIISAAIDGENVAKAIAQNLKVWIQ